MARKNIEFYLEFGLSNSGLPSHGVNKDTLTPVGSSNWGRGIGWFALGLSSFHAYTGEFAQEYGALVAILNNLKNNDGLWGQFPGSKDDFDASTSLLFIYAQLISQPCLYNSDEFIEKFTPHINSEGEILKTSGDTYSANYYSKTFGRSELSQGLFLSILSELNRCE